MTERTLLVADDEPNNLELIRLVVEESGLDVRVVTARTGLEALQSARAEHPDLILMDLKMPGLDGWEATRRLKADPLTAVIPVIALTAQAMTRDDARALAAGCDGYLTKPLDLRHLLAVLKEHLA